MSYVAATTGTGWYSQHENGAVEPVVCFALNGAGVAYPVIRGNGNRMSAAAIDAWSYEYPKGRLLHESEISEEGK